MVFGPIQFGGLASGLDTSAIIDALLNVARVPIDLLERDQAVEQSKLDLIGDLEQLVDTLREKAQDLSTLGGFLHYQATASLDGVADFLVSSDALPGAHTLTVNSLATADRYAYAGQPDSDTTQLGAGTIDFTYDGTAYSVSVSAGASTLDDVAAAINSQAGDAVTASVINAGTASSPSYQLVVAGNDTGADFALSGFTATGALGTSLGPATNIVAAGNAEIVLDGLTIQRSTNQFDGVLEGVEITVQAADAGQTITFSIDADLDAIKGGLTEFIDAYNAVIDFINDQNEYDEETGPGGDLFGDSALSSIRNTIQNAILNVDIATVQSDMLGFSTLGLVGIDIGTDGRLTMDESKVDAKMAEDLSLFADLFVDTDGFDNGGAAQNTPAYYVDTTADSGLFATLFREIDRVVDSVTDPGDPADPDDDVVLEGLFGRRKDTLNANIDRMQDQIDALEFRLESYEETLVARFAALEELMAGLNAQGSFLNGLSLPTPQAG